MERKQTLVAGSGQGFCYCRVVAVLILAVASILPARALAEPSPGGQARGMAAPRAHGGRMIQSQGAKLTIRVYDYVPVDPEVLARAEKVADAIFEDSGIEIIWMDCTPLGSDSLPYPQCPSDMGASDLVLRLLPRRMAMKLTTPHEPLGFAQQCPDMEPACELTVFCFRVDEVAAEGHRPELILGHVIAHEVAHVLIGPGHSEDGIMRREWSREELRRMSLGLQLGFTSKQTRKLQEASLRRMKEPILETSTRANSVTAQAKAGQ